VTLSLPVSLRPDPWLGALLERPCFTAIGDDGVAELPRGSHFITARLPATSIAAAHRLQDQGFRVIDAALSFAGTVNSGREASGGIREAVAADRERVGEIAATSFRYSRFHLDPEIAPATAARIKREWAENFFLGKRGDAMIVAIVDEHVAGGRWIIDLIAVGEAFRGLGLAEQMIRHAARNKRASELIVGTQAANTASVRLYERLGLRLTGAHFVLHRHGREKGGAS
jgi:ribosomal protein S18 acetylase RimI-like enzyme